MKNLMEAVVQKLGKVEEVSFGHDYTVKIYSLYRETSQQGGWEVCKFFSRADAEKVKAAFESVPSYMYRDGSQPSYYIEENHGWIGPAGYEALSKQTTIEVLEQPKA